MRSHTKKPTNSASLQLLRLLLQPLHNILTRQTEHVSASSVARAPEAVAFVLEDLVWRVELGPVDVLGPIGADVEERDDQHGRPGQYKQEQRSICTRTKEVYVSLALCRERVLSVLECRGRTRAAKIIMSEKKKT
jgi:hypothetical protein